MSDLVGIPVIFMRGGTSRGPYFKAEDLPKDEAARDRVLLAAMGSPDPRQIDGLGGADTLTSKVAIVSKSTRPGVDLDYLFAQVDIGKPIVDTEPSCGNMLAGVAAVRDRDRADPAAGRRNARDDLQRQHRGAHRGEWCRRLESPCSIRATRASTACPGTAAPIILNFMDVVGSCPASCCRPARSRRDHGIE
jgi:2-methylaconitate cis-trans-isomerase PrpF